ncbi:hypothetical protein AVM02_02645 [Brucella anthropi]
MPGKANKTSGPGNRHSTAVPNNYQPLLSMHNDEEQPLCGALITAPIGKGHHTHTSLVLHPQLDKLVPGAFHLMANLVQPGKHS